MMKQFMPPPPVNVSKMAVQTLQTNAKAMASFSRAEESLGTGAGEKAEVSSEPVNQGGGVYGMVVFWLWSSSVVNPVENNSFFT